MESELNECSLFEKHEKIKPRLNSPAVCGDPTQPVGRRHRAVLLCTQDESGCREETSDISLPGLPLYPLLPVNGAFNAFVFPN